MVLYMAVLRAFFSLQAEKKRKKDTGGGMLAAEVVTGCSWSRW